MWIISQGNLTFEINHFEGNEFEWLVCKRILCFWQKAGLWEEDRESAYWCMPAALTLYFFLSFSSNIPLSYIFFFFFFFLSSLFLNTCFLFLNFSSSYHGVGLGPIHGNGLFLWCLPWSGFTILTLNHLCLVLMYLPTTTGPSVCHYPSLDKRKLFICLFAVAPFLAMVWVPSLSLSHMACI